MVKLILASFINLLVCSSSISQQSITVKFVWSNAILGGLFFEKTAMHIPIHFENDTTTYYFQLDTGSDQTYLYSFDSLEVKPPTQLIFKNELNTDIGFIQALQLDSKKCYLEDGRWHIGTLGADFFSNKIIEIDFPMQELKILQTYDSSSFIVKEMKLSYGRPIIQIENKDKTYDFMFDTGSSLFELWTTKSIWNSLREKSAKVDEFPISSWGTINSAYRSTIIKNVNFCLCSSIKLTQVWYNSNKKFAHGFKSLKIDGIIGNKPFLDKIVLIDFKNKKIAVKHCT